jgi:hypothetical protein
MADLLARYLSLAALGRGLSDVAFVSAQRQAGTQVRLRARNETTEQLKRIVAKTSQAEQRGGVAQDGSVLTPIGAVFESSRGNQAGGSFSRDDGAAKGTSGPRMSRTARSVVRTGGHLVDASSLPTIPATYDHIGGNANAHRFATLAGSKRGLNAKTPSPYGGVRVCRWRNCLRGLRESGFDVGFDPGRHRRRAPNGFAIALGTPPTFAASTF